MLHYSQPPSSHHFYPHPPPPSPPPTRVPSMEYHPQNDAYMQHHPHHPHHHPHHHQQLHGYFHPSELSLEPLETTPGAAAEMCIPPTLLYPPQPAPPPPSSAATTTTATPTHVQSFQHQQQQHLQQQQQQQAEYVPTAHNPLKRSPSPSPSLTSASSPALPSSPIKKSRNERGERISSKDFIPPDVTGLSKREARLVKNRAAAFLSRQRKREEFEALEIRVQELELENAQLRRESNSPSGSSSPSITHASTSSSSGVVEETELARLRSELSTSTRRCSLLEKDLQRLRLQQQQQQQQQQTVKSEPVEDELSSVGSQSPLITPSSSVNGGEEDSLLSSSSSKGMMMALLLLLAPVLNSNQQQQETTSYFQDTFETFHQQLPTSSFGLFDTPTSAAAPLSFDHLLPTTQSEGLWSTVSDSTFDFSSSPPLTSASLSSSASSSSISSISSSKRQVELDVQLIRDSINPDRVKVKIVEPHVNLNNPFSNHHLPLSPPHTASDFLATAGPLEISSLPSEYSYTTPGSGGEKKRVKIAVDGDSGEWQVEVKY